MAKIMVDPGHGVGSGGSNYGASANGVSERERNLAIALAVEPLLQGAGHEVILTRRTDTYVNNSDRGCLSANLECDVFVSIHHDANDDPGPRGCHGFAHRETYENGMDLATKIATRVSETLGVPFSYGEPASDWFGKDLAVFSACSNAQKHATCALIECLFLTNTGEAQIAKGADYPATVALAIANGVQAHLGLPEIDMDPKPTSTVRVIRHGTNDVIASYEMVPNGNHIDDQQKLYVEA